MSTVVDETKLLIQNRKLTVSKIAKLTGVSSRWIFYFMKDEIKNPSIHKVQRIYDALKTDMPSTNTKSIKTLMVNLMESSNEASKTEIKKNNENKELTSIGV